MILSPVGWVRALYAWTPSARFLQAFSGWRVVFWVVLTLAAFPLGLADLVWFVTLLSLGALILSDLAGWQAGRVEVKQEKAEEREREREEE